VKQDID